MADVVVTITIPSDAVPRVAAMINADLDCGALGPKDCLKAELIRYIRDRVRAYETGLLVTENQSAIDAITDADVQ